MQLMMVFGKIFSFRENAAWARPPPLHKSFSYIYELEKISAKIGRGRSERAVLFLGLQYIVVGTTVHNWWLMASGALLRPIQWMAYWCDSAILVII